MDCIEQVRRAYAENAVYGLCYWFDEFDQNVHGGHVDQCEALLREIHAQNYPLTADELRYVKSREGVLWLCKGFLHHERGEFYEAEGCYQQSLEIQRSVRCKACEGQVLHSIHLLEATKGKRRRDPYLRELRKELQVLGGSDSLLANRLLKARAPQLPSIILAASRLPSIATLVMAVESENVRARMLGIAALAGFKTSDNLETICACLKDTNWFVRWQAARMIGRNSRLAPNCLAALQTTLEAESDSAVLQAILPALRNAKQRVDTDQLLRLLDNADPGVRKEAATLLGQTGDRRALPILQRIATGNDLFGKSIGSAVRQATRKIKQRHPLPTVKKLLLFRLEPPQQTRLLSDVFLPNDNIVCSMIVSEAKEDSRLHFRCRDKADTTVFEQSYNCGDLLVEPSLSDPIVTSSPTLVQLLGNADTPNPRGRRFQQKTPVFLTIPALSPSGWLPSTYTLSVEGHEKVSDTYEVLQDRRFSVVSQLSVKASCLSLEPRPTRHEESITQIYADTGSVFSDLVLAETIGAEIAAELSGPDGRVLERKTAQTTLGKHSRLQFKWMRDEWRVGEHEVRYWLPGVEDQPKHRFSVVREVAFQDATPCAAIDVLRRPIEPGTRFAPDVPMVFFSLRVMACPPGSRVVARWFHLRTASHAESPANEMRTHISDCVATTDARGPQHIAFSLSRRRSAWPMGDYEIHMVVLSPKQYELYSSKRTVIADDRWTRIRYTIQ